MTKYIYFSKFELQIFKTEKKEEEETNKNFKF